MACRRPSSLTTSRSTSSANSDRPTTRREDSRGSARPGTDTAQCPGSGMTGCLEDFLTTRISEGYRLDATRDRFIDTRHRPVYMADVEPMMVSATQIRERIGFGRSIDGMVPPAVVDYIMRKGLYQ